MPIALIYHTIQVALLIVSTTLSYLLGPTHYITAFYHSQCIVSSCIWLYIPLPLTYASDYCLHRFYSGFSLDCCCQYRNTLVPSQMLCESLISLRYGRKYIFSRAR
jgi:hypothetical protein